jgi:hypothetical protein
MASISSQSRSRKDNGMTHALQDALRSDLALAGHEEHLIRQAWTLYQLGLKPKNITPSQMAALGERIRTATSVEQAQQVVTQWIEDQLTKLQEQVKRGRPPSSWCVPPSPGAGAETLGRTVIQWVAGESYLPTPSPAELGRLEALQRFWDRLYDLYRYEAAMQQEMQLVDCEPGHKRE